MPRVLPEDFGATRTTLQIVAAHVLARRRFQITGRFGLRPAPGGFATPSFGDPMEALRVAGTSLVRDTVAGAAYAPIDGSTMRHLATVAGTQLTPDFSCGADTPELPDVDEPLVVDAASAGVVADWYDLGQRLLDEVCAAMPASAERAVIQLWPEHFDIGTNVEMPGGQRVDLGASPGDVHSPEPYLYVAPSSDERPGDAGYWNAPFGAALRWSELTGAADRVDVGLRFIRTGLARLQRGRE